MTDSWDEIRAWRVSARKELRQRRLEVPLVERTAVRVTVTKLIRHHFPELMQACIGFCWPFKAEIDLLELVREFVRDGATAALPVVIEKQQPLEFWEWRPGMKMAKGIWDIPIPGDRRLVQPTALLVPLVGFDDAGYRLGYGGGYYDRTLAAMETRPLTIGVGYQFGRLETIHPQLHDIPLDAIVTEAGCIAFRYRGQPLNDEPVAADTDRPVPCGPARLASSPCMMHEVDPQYFGYLSTADVIELLNLLLESERAGARGITAIAGRVKTDADQAVMRDIAEDESYFCKMLTGHIVALGGAPSAKTGAFYEKLLAKNGIDECLELLNRGQGWVARTLREALPKIAAERLAQDLRYMLDVHERNIEKCMKLG